MHALLPQLQKPGLRASDLERLFVAHRFDPDFADALASICALGDPAPQLRALNLLLRLVRAGETPSPRVIERILEHVPLETPGFAPLHLCQLLARLDAGPPESALDFLVAASADRRPFVRAWACSALFELSRRHPAHRPGIAPVLRRASRDPAPSVRARLRRARAAAARARRPSLLPTS